MIRMKRTAAVRLVLAVTLIILGAQCVPPVPPPTPADTPAAVEAIFAKYTASLSAGDADGWATLWAEDGVQMPPDAPPVFGKSQIRENLRQLLAQFRFDIRIRTEEVRAADGWAYARGMYSATLTPKAGGPQIPIDGKFLTIFARQSDGVWKIYRDIFNSNVPLRGR